MSRRFPFRTAIAGLSALAVITPAVTAPVDSTVIAAAIAQTTEAVTVTGDDTVNIKSSATFTATVPGATDGKVQFFLDGVLVATTDVNAQGIATAEITASSYGEHTITSRYVTTKDGEDYNLNPDGTTTFTTPLPTNYQMDDSGNTGTDADTYDRFQINRQTSSIDNPIELQPGDTYTLTGRMTTTSFNSRVYEVGINPAPGSTYVEGSAARYHANTTTPDTSVVVKTRADENGVATTETAGGYYPSGWGQTTDGQTWPTVNEGYVGLQSTSSYSSGGGTTWEIGANFIAPDVPGIHVPQYATYKYRSSLHVLVPMNEAAFKIAPKELPPRNEMPAEETTLTVAADKDTITDGDSSTLTATITPDNAAGTVQFKNNGENIGSPVQVENGTAELTHTLPLGTNNITADFTPENEADFTPATAAATTVTVEKAPATDTTLAYTGETAGTIGEPVELSAKVNPDNADGSIQFFEVVDGSEQPVGNAVETQAGVATSTYTPDSAGTKSFKAVFTPTDTDGFKDSETAFEVTVDKQAIALQLTADENKKGGDPVAITATAEPKVEGTVTFFNGDQQIGESPVDTATGTATINDAFATGRHELRAEFTPADANTYNTAEAAHTLVIGSRDKKDTSVELAIDPNELKVGETATVTATVTNATNGLVTFTDNDGVKGWAPVNNGKATFTYTPKSAGTKTIKGEFVPTEGAADTHNGSTGTTTATVNPAPITEKRFTTMLLAGPNKAITNEGFTLTAFVSPKDADGTVTFYNGTDSIGTAPVNDGKATLPVQGMPKGSYQFKAEFAPSNEDAFSTSEATHSVLVADEKPPVTVTNTTTSIQPTTVRETTTEPTTVTNTVTSTKVEPTTVFVTTTEPTTVRETTTEPTTVNHTATTTSVKVEPTTVRETTTEPTTVNHTATTTSVKVEPTTVRETTTEPTTVRETTTESTTVRETTTEPTTVNHTATTTSVKVEPTTVNVTVTTTKVEPTTVFVTTTEPTTVNHTATTTSVKVEPTTVRETTTEPTTVRETTTEPTTVRETTTEPTTVRETTTEATTVRETTTEPTTVRETTTEATTVRETTTTTAAAEKPVPSAPAVDASRALETADGRAIMLTAGVSPKTKGRVIFELADGTKLGEATIDADGTARFTHTFTKPGSYEVRSYVLAEDGTEGERSVPVTVTVAAKDPADNPGEPGTGNGDTSSSGSSTDNGGSSTGDSSSSGSSSSNNEEGSSLENNRTASLALGGGLLALLLSALAVVVVNTPMVRDWFEQMGIRF